LQGIKIPAARNILYRIVPHPFGIKALDDVT